MPPELPPTGRQVAGAGMIDLEEFGAECFGPQLKDAVNTVAREPGTQEPRRRQSTPGRVTCTRIACRGIAKTAVAAQIAMEAIGVHGVEKLRRLAFRGNDRRPPLVADRGNIHEIEELEWHVRLQQRIGLAIVEHTATQVGKPL